jgi:hypothetical protein
VTHATPCKEVLRLRHFGGVDFPGTPDLFDHVSQRRVYEALIELAVAHGSRHHHLSDFTQQSGAEAQRRADHAFRKRQDVRARRHRRTLPRRLNCRDASGGSGGRHSVLELPAAVCAKLNSDWRPGFAVPLRSPRVPRRQGAAGWAALSSANLTRKVNCTGWPVGLLYPIVCASVDAAAPNPISGGSSERIIVSVARP